VTHAPDDASRRSHAPSTEYRVPSPAPRCLVLGIGNLLMGDEGVGVHAVRRLERERDAGAPDLGGVAIVDGGTGGFHLLEYLSAYDPVILIDATMDAREPGTVTLLEPRYASDFPRALTAHDIGLRDLVESAMLLSGLPRIHLLTVSIDAIQAMQTDLSPAIEAAIPEVIARVRALVADCPVRATV
jgi:hydrogenase maturation protease